MSRVEFFKKICEPPADLSLYIHLPFCRGKCHYCDFYSIDVGCVSDDRIEPVLVEIIRQLDYMITSLSAPIIRTVYIGGGTPTVIDATRFESLLKDIIDICGTVPPEATIEANPGSLTRDHLSVFSDAGVTRLSVGVQTFDPMGRKIIGRRCSDENLTRGLDYIGNFWRGDSNIDLICGIPGIEPDVTMADCRRVMDECDPHHVSLYFLTIEEQTPLWRMVQEGTVTPPDEDLLSEIWHRCIDLLEERYRHYEVSSFAKPGHESRHNLGYWQMKPYIGCGPAAVSNIPSGESFLRVCNPPDIAKYLHGHAAMWSADVEETGRAESVFEYFMMGLRTTTGVDLAGIANRFGRSTVDAFQELFLTWQDRGLVITDTDSIHCTERGLSILNQILVELLGVVQATCKDSNDS
jgi:oxygen-independent coproporphyrinogen III oxidase